MGIAKNTRNLKEIYNTIQTTPLYLSYVGCRFAVQPTATQKQKKNSSTIFFKHYQQHQHKHRRHHVWSCLNI